MFNEICGETRALSRLLLVEDSVDRNGGRSKDSNNKYYRVVRCSKWSMNLLLRPQQKEAAKHWHLTRKCVRRKVKTKDFVGSFWRFGEAFNKHFSMNKKFTFPFVLLKGAGE